MDALSRIPIHDLIPHRPPMALVDRLLSYEDGGACCEVVIGPDHLFLGEDGVPAYLGMELMAQTLAAMNGYKALEKGREPDVGFLLGTPKFKTHCAHFKLGQCLRVEVRLVWGDDELRQFECEIKDAKTEALLQTATINAFVPNDLDSYLKKERRP